jgi:hypothetical protein
LELSTQLKILRQSTHQEKSQELRTGTQDEPLDPGDGKDFNISAGALKKKDIQIEGLQLELAELEVRLAQEENVALSRMRQVEGALLQAKVENIRLTENVESYQMLLQERTMKGEYPLMGLPLGQESGSPSSRPNSRLDECDLNVTSLATELEEAEISEYSRIRGISIGSVH